MMLRRDQAEHAAVSLSMAAGWLVLEANGVLTVEQRDAPKGIRRCLHPLGPRSRPRMAMVALAEVSG
jgi:hypothetical protein